MASQTAETVTQNGEMLELLTRQIQLLEKQTQMLEKQNQLHEETNKLLKKSNSNTASTSEKTSAIEWRQCQLGGEANDAARMTSIFLRGHSATWSSKTKRTILEQIVNKGQVAIVQHRGLYSEKDLRRGQLLALVFYKTYCKKSEVLYDAFAEHDPNCDELWPLLPSFRQEMLQEASKRDNELGDKANGSTAEGDRVAALKQAFCKIPSELQALFNEMLPLNKKYEPLPKGNKPDSDASFEEVHKLPEEAKTFFEWAKGNQLSSHKDERMQNAEAISKWCWHVADTARKLKELKKAEFYEELGKVDKVAQKQKEDIDTAILERLIQAKFPAYHAIGEQHAAREAAKQAAKEKAEETAKTKAEGPAEISEGRA